MHNCNSNCAYMHSYCSTCIYYFISFFSLLSLVLSFFSPNQQSSPIPPLLLNHSRPINIKLTPHSSTTSSLQSRPTTISAPYPPTPPNSSLNNSLMTSPPPPTESTPSCSTASSPSLFQNPKTTRTRLIEHCS